MPDAYGGAPLDIMEYGAKGNTLAGTDGSIDTGTNVFTSPTTTFTTADIGKTILIRGAGATGGLYRSTITRMTSNRFPGQESNTIVLGANASTTVSGVAFQYGTNDFAAIQAAINDQQVYGGSVYVPTPPGIGFLCVEKLVCSPTITTDATRTCLITGDGMFASVILQGDRTNFNTNGIFAYSRPAGTPKVAQVVMRDVCIDGNYEGAGGVIPQWTSSQGALVALPNPFQIATGNTAAFDGIYHEFERVRFYRPPGYTTQPSRSLHLKACLFDKCGQPDLSTGSTHWDNLGSGGNTDVIVEGCEWKDSSGNYADFIDGGSKPIRATFVNNASTNHQIGGLYVGGNGSIIMGNVLRNTNVGGYVGYDSGTAAGLRSKNIVVGNRLVGINLLSGAAVFSNATYGDILASNSANDV